MGPRLERATKMVQRYRSSHDLDFPMTPHPLCVPEEIKEFTSDPVDAYRTYYVTHKSNIAKWQPHATPPNWWPKGE